MYLVRNFHKVVTERERGNTERSSANVQQKLLSCNRKHLQLAGLMNKNRLRSIF